MFYLDKRTLDAAAQSVFWSGMSPPLTQAVHDHEPAIQNNAGTPGTMSRGTMI
jgi:hypothetical protein